MPNSGDKYLGDDYLFEGLRYTILLNDKNVFIYLNPLDCLYRLNMNFDDVPDDLFSVEDMDDSELEEILSEVKSIDKRTDLTFKTLCALREFIYNKNMDNGTAGSNTKSEMERWHRA